MLHTVPNKVQANAKKGLEMAKSPDISNNSLPETSMKGGKKLASGKQISDDHVRAMAEYHGAHNGECPANDGVEGCDDMLWGGNAGGQWASTRVAAMDATTLSEDKGPELATLLAGDDSFSIELYTRPDLLLEGKTDLAKDSDGLIWAPILRSGTLACRPDPTAPNGRKMDPLVFVAGHASSAKEIGLADLKAAFEETAVQHVTIPKTHQNNEFENTGFIEKLKIADSTLRPGEKVLLAGHKFLDADAESRVERGLIANRSCGILHGYQNTETGKTYPHVIEHVALTNKPWVSGMEAYGQDLFSDGREVVSLMLSDNLNVFIEPAEPTKMPPELFSTATPRERLEAELKLSDIAWGDDDQPSMNQIHSGLYDALDKMGQSPYMDEPSQYFSVHDVKPTSALIRQHGNGTSEDDNAWVVPFSFDSGKLSLGDFSQWTPTKKAWVKDDDAKTDANETQQALDQDPTNLSVSAAERNSAKSNGDSMSDGTFPITNQKQANKAWILRGSSKKHSSAEVIAHIKKQVAKHKLTMPASNHADDLPSDPLKRASALRLSRGSHTPAPTGGTSMGLTPELIDSLNLDDTGKELLRTQMAQEQRDATELAEHRKTQKEQGRETRLSRVKEVFGEGATGLLAEVEALLMADDNDVAVSLMLSDGAGVARKTDLTITQAIDRLLAAMPKAGASVAKTALSDKTNLLQSPLSARPDLKPDPTADPSKVQEMSADQLLSQWSTDLGGQLDLAIKPTPTPASA
jgi:hypothetical protein